MNEWAHAEQGEVGGSRSGLAQVAGRWDVVRPVCKVLRVYSAI